MGWAKKMLVNISKAGLPELGFFAGDRTDRRHNSETVSFPNRIVLAFYLNKSYIHACTISTYAEQVCMQVKYNCRGECYGDITD